MHWPAQKHAREPHKLKPRPPTSPPQPNPHSPNATRRVRAWGCKSKPPKIPSPQFQPRHDRIQIDDLSSARSGEYGAMPLAKSS